MSRRQRPVDPLGFSGQYPVHGVKRAAVALAYRSQGHALSRQTPHLGYILHRYAVMFHGDPNRQYNGTRTRCGSIQKRISSASRSNAISIYWLTGF